MSCHQKTRFSRLGLEGRAQPPPPSQPEPEPEPEPQSDAEYSSDNDEDPRLKEEYNSENDGNREHDLQILEALQQKLCESRAHRHYEAFARQQAMRFLQKEASRRRLEAQGQCRRQAPATLAAMLHRQMRVARDEKWPRTQAAKAKNEDEADPSRAPTKGH
nr:uncharacterized protein LOC127327132 [Lolium perenne]